MKKQRTRNALLHALNILLLVGIVLSIIPQTATADQTFFIVRDLETGQEYPVLVGGVWDTVPGLCDDTDNGFKPFTTASITIENPHSHTIHQFTDTISGSLVGEYACGNEITLDGKRYPRFAFLLWWDPATK